MRLEPETAPGARFRDIARELAPRFRERAAALDERDAFAHENFDDLKSAGIMGAFVPEELGGLGLQSIHDWAVGLAALAEGDASTAIALNMHLGVSRNIALAWRAADARGSDGSRDRNGGMLRAIAAGQLVICATATEGGTDFLRPRTTATRNGEELVIDGHKIFVTLSPIAQVYAINVRIPAEGDGDDQIGFVFVPAGTAGIKPQDDWRALGMRASGSQSVRFEGCRVPAASLQVAGPWGRWTPGLLMGRTLANLTLVGAFLGIAERARGLAVEAAQAQSKPKFGGAIGGAAGVQHLLGEIDVSLAAARATLSLTASRLDDLLLSLAGKTPDLETAHRCMADYQCAKWTVNQTAIEVVSKSMDVCGGAAFMQEHELSRLYRDVRAGPFMQPFSPTEAREYVGQVAIGRYPEG